MPSGREGTQSTAAHRSHPWVTLPRKTQRSRVILGSCPCVVHGNETSRAACETDNTLHLSVAGCGGQSAGDCLELARVVCGGCQNRIACPALARVGEGNKLRFGTVPNGVGCGALSHVNVDGGRLTALDADTRERNVPSSGCRLRAPFRERTFGDVCGGADALTKRLLNEVVAAGLIVIS